MPVDQVDQGEQVVAGGVVFGVLAQFAPALEEHQFRVPGAASFGQIAGGSIFGTRGVRFGAPGSSTCNLRSAAFSNRAAEILGSLGPDA